MLDNHPIISIIIPVHNAEAFITKALDSCIQQSFSDFEIVAVDDGSKDYSLSILKEYAARDRRVRVFTGANAGVVVARETGVRESQGEFLLFMDADDTLVEDCLQNMVDAITPDVDMIIGNINQVETDGSSCMAQYGNHGIVTGKEHFDWIVSHRVGFLWGKLIRRSLMDCIKIMPYGVQFCEDYLQMLQLSYHARNVVHINDTTYNYIQQDTSVCNKTVTALEYAQRFANICHKIEEIINLRSYDTNSIIKLKVLYLYYCRLYLSVSGSWGKNMNLRSPFKAYLYDKSVALYSIMTDKKRYISTLATAYLYPIIADSYRKQLRKNGRIN